MFRKPTSSNNYVHFFSFTSLSIKIGVAHGLFLRAFRICKNENFLNNEITYIFDSLTALAYPKHVLHSALKKARVTHNKERNEKPKIDFKNSIVVPYTPFFDNMRPILKSC